MTMHDLHLSYRLAVILDATARAFRLAGDLASKLTVFGVDSGLGPSDADAIGLFASPGAVDSVD
jgi:hypothetical protein